DSSSNGDLRFANLTSDSEDVDWDKLITVGTSVGVVVIVVFVSIVCVRRARRAAQARAESPKDDQNRHSRPDSSENFYQEVQGGGRNDGQAQRPIQPLPLPVDSAGYLVPSPFVGNRAAEHYANVPYPVAGPSRRGESHEHLSMQPLPASANGRKKGRQRHDDNEGPAYENCVVTRTKRKRVPKRHQELQL
ncbi:hypothetical protein BaRGS_00013369, partial [Batillaria attramentaria]